MDCSSITVLLKAEAYSWEMRRPKPLNMLDAHSLTVTLMPDRHIIVVQAAAVGWHTSNPHTLISPTVNSITPQSMTIGLVGQSISMLMRSIPLLKGVNSQTVPMPPKEVRFIVHQKTS